MPKNLPPTITYPFLGLAAGYLLPLAGMTIEDYRHGIDISHVLTGINHHIPAVIIGLISMFAGYIHGLKLEQKAKAEKDLLRSQKILKNVTDGINDHIMLLSADHRVMWANKGLIKQTGLSLEKIIGKKCHEVTFGTKLSCTELGLECPAKNLSRGTDDQVGFTHQTRIDEHNIDKDYEVLFL